MRREMANLGADMQAQITSTATTVSGLSTTLMAHHIRHEPGGGDAMAVDAATTVGSLRTLGYGATQAVPGNTNRIVIQHGSATLVNGQVTIACPGILAGADVTFGRGALGGTLIGGLGDLRKTAVVPGASFTVQSSLVSVLGAITLQNLDNGTFTYDVYNP